MSAASQSNIDRFNKYKSLCDAAASACIRTFLHIVRPAEGFSYHSNHDIHRAWLEWKDAEEVFYHMTGHGVGWGEAPNRIFPAPPPEDAEHLPCRQMWGCLLQEQVERQDFQGPLIKNAVAAIMASEACKSHPASCACKVPNSPWTWHECVAELEPLGIKHNPKCQCGGWQTCKQKVPSLGPVASIMAAAQQKAEGELAASPALKAELVPCRCEAQSSAVSCSCLPGRVAEARLKAKEAAAKPEQNEDLDACYCDARYSAITCGCLPDSLAGLAATGGGGGGGGLQVLAEVTAKTPLPVPLPVPLVRQSTYDYQHHVETCACGTCHKARVDSGTDDAYLERCRENSKRTLAEMNNRLKRQDESFRESCPDCKASARGICVECHVAMNSYDERHYLKMPSALHMIRQAYILEEASWIARKKEEPTPEGGSFSAAINKASGAISVAAAKAGGVNSEGFVKELFAAMGTPYDSTCPHGLPFYSCMPCSH